MIASSERADRIPRRDIDVGWHDDAPALLVRLDDGQLIHRPLSAAECAALIRRLAGYLTYWHRAIEGDA